MSDELLAERIWRYAMQPGNATVDASGPSAQIAPGAKLDDGSNVSTDLSGSFQTMLSNIQFHGLAESESEIMDASNHLAGQGAKDHKRSEDISHSPDTNHGLNGSEQSVVPSLVTSEPNVLRTEQPTTAKGLSAAPLENGHVIQHVTDASTHGAIPFVGPVTDVATVAAAMPTQEERRKEYGHSKPFIKRTKASSFHVRPEESSSPHPLKRINTMPPRLNRYAPRDIQPSSQDSFAGSPPKQDLNSFIRNSEVFNNLYIRPGVGGRPSEIFELQADPSAESSTIPPSKKHKVATASSTKGKKAEEEKEEEETASQLMQMALEHGLIQKTPTQSSAPLPVVLVKDSQSDHHYSEDDLSGSRNVSGDEMEIHSDNPSGSPQAIDHSPAPSSSSFVLPRPPAVEESESTQATQLASQDIPPGVIIVSPYDLPVGGDSGFSSLPIPEHRRLEFAALQRYRNRDEIVPATPISTVPPSVQDPSTLMHDNVEPIDRGQSTRSTRKGKEKAQNVETILKRPEKSKPASKIEGLRRSERVRSAPNSKDDNHPQTVVASNEIVPDSQEEQNSNTSLKVPPPDLKPAQIADEVVPDSQEELQKLQQEQEQQEPSRDDLFSSPSIPLVQQVSIRSLSSSPSIPLIQTTNREGSSRFPTPTPAAVKSPLRKGQLPAGVTHTRGRGRSNSGGRQTTKVGVPRVDEGSNGDEEERSDEENNAMVVDEKKEEEEPDVEPSLRRKASGGKRKGPAIARGKRATRRGHGRTTAVGGGVISRKRKSDPKLEQQRSETSLPPQKRHRSHMTTPVPSVAIELNKRVIARREDDEENYYYVGTVHIEYVASDPTPTSAFIEFDDGHNEMVDLEDMRSLHLEPGDLIEVTKYKKNKYRRATVLDTDHWDNEVVQVHDVESGPDGDDYDVNSGDIRVSEEQIRLQWNERYINLRSLCKDKEFTLPRRNRHLSGYAFIVTLPDLPKSKRSLQRIIELSGGVVCEWNSIVSLSGTSEIDGSRVVGKSSDVHLVKSKTKSKGLFCIADEPRTTPKFLIALALGVPCLSVDWVLAQVDGSEIKLDWQAYVLPAGMNPITKLAASQNFDRMWWRDIDNYPQLLSKPPISKIFAGKSFLCVGSSFIPKGKKFGTYPQVLLAMGATTVQAVTDLKHLNVKGQVEFDYTVVDDDAELLSYDDALGVDISWIKKCLITGVEGPVPWPE